MPDAVKGAPEDGFDRSLDVPASTFRAGSRFSVARIRRDGADGDTFVDRVRVARDGGVDTLEGDIDVSPKSWTEIVTFGLSIRSGNGTWPNGVLYYVTQPAVAAMVEAAIAHWQQKTPLRFTQGIGGGDYLQFEDRGICRSRIGCTGGVQVVELDRNCTLGAVVHEIGHAVGLWHEHSRQDRDSYVRILEANVADGQLPQFAKCDNTAVNRGSYDLDSVMHYPSDAFSRNHQPTIVKLDGSLLPPRNGLSAGDIAAVRALYPGLAW